jgi:CelD/BcsL family acetyltransferase involved in cellulose biosynthesis
MYRVAVASFDDFLGSRHAWNALAASTPFPCVFQTWEWTYCWWKHFGSELSHLPLFVHRDDQLVAILPLARYPQRLGACWQRRCDLTGTVELATDHVDVLCTEANAASALRAIGTWLDAPESSWDVIRLALVTSESLLYRHAAELTAEHRFRIHREQRSTAPYLAITGSFEQYMATQNKRHRYQINTPAKRLVEQHGVRYVPCSPATFEAGLETLFRLHASRARQKQITSTFSGSKVISFHREFTSLAAEQGWVWLRLLETPDTALAASYAFVYGQRVFDYQLGIDSRWEKLSPGTAITREAIAEAHRCGHLEYNFLQGNEAYKYLWTRTERPLFTVSVFNQTMRGRLAEAWFRVRGHVRRKRGSARVRTSTA